ncbi:MAG TPA: hypothetical protein PK724_08015, partial [Pseudomonadales bacterium]|nr:hypothetical protein [Pseudomonadales bacterium]
MLKSVLKAIFGDKHSRTYKELQPIVQEINEHYASLASLSDFELKEKVKGFKEHINKETEELRGKINELRDQLTSVEGEVENANAIHDEIEELEKELDQKYEDILDELLPEVFAVAKDTCRRLVGKSYDVMGQKVTWDMVPYDVQLMGGITLHEGRIAEMRTGEGKTLVATLPAYLNALAGKGVHLVTVNDYLAQRDANWMAPVYRFLGMSVGVILSRQDQASKREAYAADITYGTNNEYGFDYLRDNMAFTVEERVQRALNFAIVDEVDSILIDEARTPLIISGQAEDSSELYRRINRLIPKLTRAVEASEVQPAVAGHYLVDEKLRQVELTEEGHEHVEQLLTEAGLLGEGESLYSAANLGLLHHVHTALRAHVLFHRDVEYIVQNGQVILIDEHTGRTMPGRRLSEGLHQAIEAREGVAVQAESQTLASTTFQNYFRLYHKLSGMTGTADTEAFELKEIYNLDVVVIPTNKPMLRIDH